MFVTDRVLDIILQAKNDSHSLAVSAINSSHAVSIGALSNEIVALKRTLAAAEEQLRYERARADGLVDRLLVRDARVAAVTPSAVAAAVHKDAEAVKKLTAIFDEINMAGVDFPSKEQRAFEMAGGTAIDPGHSGV